VDSPVNRQAARQRALLTNHLTALTSPLAGGGLVDMVPMVVGFVGGIGSGKSSCADDLVQRFAFERASFATALKESVYRTLAPLPGVERRHFFGTQADKAEPIPSLGGATGRKVLELVGTDGYRAAYADVWVDLAMALRSAGVRYVFDDVRFPNEAGAIRKAGGILIRVDCIGNPSSVRTGHASDQWETIPTDFQLIARYGELDQLRSDARAALFYRATA
jgi:hypothetical protein